MIVPHDALDGTAITTARSMTDGVQRREDFAPEPVQTRLPRELSEGAAARGGGYLLVYLLVLKEGSSRSSSGVDRSRGSSTTHSSVSTITSTTCFRVRVAASGQPSPCAGANDMLSSKHLLPETAHPLVELSCVWRAKHHVFISRCAQAKHMARTTRADKVHSALLHLVR